MKIGTLRNVPLSEVWKHEAYDFTPWLCQRIDLINDATGLQLDPDALHTEKAAGRFSLDIYGKSGERTVIIENQYRSTDHKHLGQLITYAASLEADVAIWVCEQPRQEHVKAIGWLNDNTDTQFFLVKIEAVTIDGLTAAPRVTVIAAPSEDVDEVREVKRTLQEDGLPNLGYWERLLDLGRTVEGFHWNNSGSRKSWLNKVAFSGERAYFTLIIRTTERQLLFQAERTDSKEWNQTVVDGIAAVVDANLRERFPGYELERTERADVNSAKIVVHLPGSGLTESGDVIDAKARDHAEQMVKFEAIIAPHVQAAIDAANAAEAAAIATAEAEEAAEQRDAGNALTTS